MNDATQAKQIKYKYNIWNTKTKTQNQKGVSEREREREKGIERKRDGDGSCTERECKKIAPVLRVKSIQSYDEEWEISFQYILFSLLSFHSFACFSLSPTSTQSHNGGDWDIAVKKKHNTRIAYCCLHAVLWMYLPQFWDPHVDAWICLESLLIQHKSMMTSTSHICDCLTETRIHHMLIGGFFSLG